MKRRFQLSESTVSLPRGTRVVLRTDVAGSDGFVHRSASLATVREVQYDSYVVETPSGRRIEVARDQITVQKRDALDAIVRRQFSHRLFRDEIIFSTVVGSRAWGLANENSDEDVRGVFVLPFEVHTSLWTAPDELESSDGQEIHWEIEKFVVQGLRGDANTLECLWSPLLKHATPMGQLLIDRREIFISMNVLGSFGRYAESQFERIGLAEGRAEILQALIAAANRGELATHDDALRFCVASKLARDERSARAEVKSALTSLVDRGLLPSTELGHFVRRAIDDPRSLEPPVHRPKNAYNLLRLLHSCVSWLRHGRPLIQVEEPLRSELLAIKEQRTPIAETLVKAKQVAREIDEIAKSSTLPETPNHEAADELLRVARREQARKHFSSSPLRFNTFEIVPRLGFEPELIPFPLPTDVDVESLRRFLSLIRPGVTPGFGPDRYPLWVGLTGAHAYGFPSPDSDLDLKAIHAVPASRVLGLDRDPAPTEWLGDHEGREYDFSSHEIGQAVTLLLKGNGNMLERLLGPFSVMTTSLGSRLRDLARGSLSRRCYHHYRGFFVSMRKQYASESAEGKRSVKRLLYCYRVALTGAHLLRTGVLETDVSVLAPEYGFDRVTHLVHQKRSGEKILLEGDDAPDLASFDRLDRLLDAELSRSPLPEGPPNLDKLESLVIEARILADDTLTRRSTGT